MRVSRILAVLTACSLLCGCANRGAAESSGGLFVGIEPAQDSAEQAKYGDGTYVSQTVHEPVPDPYKSDTALKKEGTTPEGIRYALYQKHAEITGHTAKFDAEELVIPGTIGELPVTKIASVPEPEESIFDIDKTGGFYSCYSLKKVTLPEGLTDIGDYAFYGCRNLKEIEIPETVARIGRRAFAMCGSLNKLTVPAAIDTIATLYRDGLGVEQDYKKAADLYWMAWNLCDEQDEKIRENAIKDLKEKYDQLIRDGKIPADYEPKEVTFETK